MMESENEVQSAKEIDFCTMGMFIIGERLLESFYACFQSSSSPLPFSCQALARLHSYFFFNQMPSDASYVCV